MKKEVKTSIDGLEIGMFISRLDRPWIKTPYSLEGITVESQEDIERLRKYCNYVYVDVEQGVSPEPRFWILTENPKSQTFGVTRSTHTQESREKERKEYQALRKTTYRTSEKFSTEIKTAKKVSSKLSGDYKQLLSDLQSGREVDIEVVKAGVSDMVESVIKNPSAMMWIIQLKKLDEYSYSRALGTSVWCATFGRHLGLEKEAINQLALGGLLLDIGKSRLPPHLLKNNGELTEEEARQMHEHVDLGIKILVSSPLSPSGEKVSMDVMQMIATHHERADGSGYPQGLLNKDIPIYGRIAGIVDSYDAMTSERPYIKAGQSAPHDAIAELYELRDTRFQAELVEQFIQTVGLYPTGSLVELSTGQVGAVVAINGLRRLRPTLMLLLDENKEPYAQFTHLDLTKAGEEITVERGLPPGSYGIDMHELFL
jgi:HD-GYP domain-containing protein (c-di-GMP phosphodiesterase class II)